jgi:hypothetical protein
MPEPTRLPGIPAVIDDRVLAPSVRVLVDVVSILIGQRKDQTYSIVQMRAKVADLERRVAALGG